MRDDLTFHVLRITLVANSANIAAETLSQVQTTLFSKQSNGRRARADTDEKEDADSTDATPVRGQRSEVRGPKSHPQISDL